MNRKQTMATDVMEEISRLPRSQRDWDELEHHVALILVGMDLQQYLPAFAEHNISLERFKQLTDSDLVLLGVDNLQHRQRILRNVSLKANGQREEVIVPYNSSDDRKIIKNILSETYYLEKNLDFLLKNLSRFTPTDYFVAGEHSGLSLAKLVTEKAIQQTEIIRSRIYNPYQDCMIRQLTSKGIPLQKSLERKLEKKRRPNIVIWSATAVILSAILMLLPFRLS